MTSDPVPFSVLIMAAGQGERLGAGLPKQYLEIGGKTILRRTLEAFLSLPGLKSLRVVIDPAHVRNYEKSVAGLTLGAPVFGGSDRKQSVWNGLESFYNLLSEDLILIHDAARPFVSKCDISNILQYFKDQASRESLQAATLAVPVSETVRRGCDGLAQDILDRAGLWTIQTPQAFRYGTLRRAHETAPPGSYTDDTGLVSAIGIPVRLVPGSRDNIKITTPEDLIWAKDYVFMRERAMFETRTASGFDVHAFTKAGEKTAVRLCGIDIAAPFGLEGHSDADAGLHALADALLGTIAAGDIGVHFPPSDSRWRGADSREFIDYVFSLVRGKGGRIIHVDMTIICETPKIGPYRAAMQRAIGNMLNLPPDRVSIKATTTEGLGFLGRQEGLAAQAMVSVEFPQDRVFSAGHDPARDLNLTRHPNQGTDHDPAHDPVHDPCGARGSAL